MTHCVKLGSLTPQGKKNLAFKLPAKKIALASLQISPTSGTNKRFCKLLWLLVQVTPNQAKFQKTTSIVLYM